MNLEMQERLKYTRMWDQPRYRQYSPGEACAAKAIAALAMAPGESVTDFGCGTGRAAPFSNVTACPSGRSIMRSIVSILELAWCSRWPVFGNSPIRWS